MSRWFFVLLRRTSRRFFLSLQELPLRRRAAHLAEPGPWAAPDGGRLGAQGAARPRRKDGDRDTHPREGGGGIGDCGFAFCFRLPWSSAKVSVKGKFQKKKKKMYKHDCRINLNLNRTPFRRFYLTH